ncbi:MAG: hypothetical protein ACRDD1_11985 [Planctomycetia bacterium]
MAEVRNPFDDKARQNHHFWMTIGGCLVCMFIIGVAYSRADKRSTVLHSQGGGVRYAFPLLYVPEFKPANS